MLVKVMLSSSTHREAENASSPLVRTLARKLLAMLGLGSPLRLAAHVVPEGKVVVALASYQAPYLAS